jgi:hypothetical protein
MDMLVEQVDVWAAAIPDRPGGLADALAALSDAGADLQFIVARRAAEKPGTGVVFVTPLQGDREIAAAAQVGFNVTHTVHSVRIMGPDRRGTAPAGALGFSEVRRHLVPEGGPGESPGTSPPGRLALNSCSGPQRAGLSPEEETCSRGY